METGLRDREGNKINIGDILHFKHYDGAEWTGKVVFADGVVTVDCFKDFKQIKNPDKWNHEHNWIKSRNWSSMVGYPEFGTWNCCRQPLTAIADCWRKYEDVKPLYEKCGCWEDRILDVVIVKGDSHD